MKNKQRIVYLDMVRILACILVVLVHVSAQQMEALDVNSAAFAVTNAFNILSFSGVSLFVMISGALALNPQKEEDIRTVLLRRTVHFFVLYYIWKFFYQIVDMVQKGIAFTPENIKEELVLALVKQRGYYHLWYLPMIAILYMMVPIIKKGFADKGTCKYFLTVFFVTALWFPTLFQYEFKFKYLFVSFFEMNDFYLFGSYLGYFVLGHFLHQWGKNISQKGRRIVYLAGIVCFAVACIFETLKAKAAGVPVYGMQTPFVAPHFFTTTALFYGMQALGSAAEQREGLKAGITFLATAALGIYLVHPFVLELFKAVGLDTALCFPAISIPLILAGVLVVSGLITMLLLKIPGIRRLVQ